MKKLLVREIIICTVFSHAGVRYNAQHFMSVAPFMRPKRRDELLVLPFSALLYWQQSRESVRNRLILISCMFDQLHVPKKNRSSFQQSDKRSVGSRYQSSLTQRVLCLVSRMGSMHTETLEGRNLATIRHHRASNCTYTKSISYQPYCFKWHKCSE